MLVVMLDLAAWDGVSRADQGKALLRELRAYQPALAERPRLKVGSRADIAAPDAAFDGLWVSAVDGTGIPQLLGQMAEAVRAARAAEAEAASTEFTILRPVAEGIAVEKVGPNAYEVLGRSALRAVRLSDLTDVEALEHAHRRLESLGVNKALRRAGAGEGDLVHIGDLTFEFEEDA